MKILLIGASGVIGSAIRNALADQHEVVTAGSRSGDITVDLGDPASIRAMFDAVGPLDAVIAAAGNGVVRPLDELTDLDFDRAVGVQMMGQVNLIRFGRKALREGGSITLTTGPASSIDFPGAAAIAMALAGLERFVGAAAGELHGLRVNIVSPIYVKETMAKLGMPSEGGLSAADTAKAYLAALNGDMHGKVLITPDYA